MSKINFQLASISKDQSLNFFKVLLYIDRLLRSSELVFCLQIHDIRDPDLLKKRGVTIIDVGNDKVDHKVGFCCKRAQREYSGSVVECLTQYLGQASKYLKIGTCPALQILLENMAKN